MQHKSNFFPQTWLLILHLKKEIMMRLFGFLTSRLLSFLSVDALQRAPQYPAMYH